MSEQVTREELAEGMRGLELFFARPGESANDTYERIGAVFQSETCYLRPGKSYPRCSPAPDDRQQVWDNWCAKKVFTARALLSRLDAEQNGGGE